MPVSAQPARARKPSAPGRAAKPGAPIKWPSGPALAPPLYRKQASASGVQVGGRTVVDINVRGPADASVRSLQASNQRVPLQVNLGRTMAGAA